LLVAIMARENDRLNEFEYSIRITTANTLVASAILRLIGIWKENFHLWSAVFVLYGSVLLVCSSSSPVKHFAQIFKMASMNYALVLFVGVLGVVLVLMAIPVVGETLRYKATATKTKQSQIELPLLGKLS